MRLIDADELKKSLTYDICGRPLHGNLKTNYANIRTTILAQPTIDPIHAAGACYCRECKYFNMQEMECQNDRVSTDHEGGASYSLNFWLDDFCSYGEPKEETK